MMPDYSSWGMTLQQNTTDFERAKLTPNDWGKIPTGYARWTKYDDGNWYYVTEGGEQFGAIAQAYLCSGSAYEACAFELFNAQPAAFKTKAAAIYGWQNFPEYAWGGGARSGLFSGTTMSANVPVLMPSVAVELAKKNGFQWDPHAQYIEFIPLHRYGPETSGEGTTSTQKETASSVGKNLLIGIGLAGLLAAGLWWLGKRMATENPDEMRLYQVNDEQESVSLEELRFSLDSEQFEKVQALGVEDVAHFGSKKIRRVY